MAKTSEIATGFFGDKLYQKRARIVLPILVRQAKAEEPIFYEDLAQEIGIPNPRNLNYPLGCIGDALNELAAEWGAEIPHIQAMVRNKNTGLPGDGFDGFFEDSGKSWTNAKERRAVIEAYWAEIAAYPYWGDVLDALELEPVPPSLNPIIAAASRNFGGGEGEAHRKLKKQISKNPAMVGLISTLPKGIVEYPLPSGDSIDVVFEAKSKIHAVEVKPADAPIHDITRGLFQCVKYLSVLQARSDYRQDNINISVCLALGGDFPNELIALKNSVGIRVVTNLQKKR